MAKLPRHKLCYICHNPLGNDYTTFKKTGILQERKVCDRCMTSRKSKMVERVKELKYAYEQEEQRMQQNKNDIQLKQLEKAVREEKDMRDRKTVDFLKRKLGLSDLQIIKSRELVTDMITLSLFRREPAYVTYMKIDEQFKETILTDKQKSIWDEKLDILNYNLVEDLISGITSEHSFK